MRATIRHDAAPRPPMTGRKTERAERAIAEALRTGDAAAAAAAHGVHIRTVQRGLVAAGKAKPRGRPVGKGAK